MKLYRVDGRAVFNADKEDALELRVTMPSGAIVRVLIPGENAFGAIPEEDGRAVAERIATLLEASDA